MKPSFKMRPKPLPNSAAIPLALDSGAFSLYNQLIRKRTHRWGKGMEKSAPKKTDAAIVETPEFQKYLQDYQAFLHQHRRHFHFAVTLDVIFNDEATWRIFRQLRDAGTAVMPVFHLGEDLAYLKRYMDECEYIGLGGLGNTTMEAYIPFGNKVWKLLTDDKGRPLRRVHGFAMSSWDFLARWPWYSVDSTTAFTFSRMGALMMPQWQGKDFKFGVTATIFPVSARRGHHNRHVGHAAPNGVIRQAVLAYLEKIGVSEEDAQTEYIVRDICNLFFMNRSVHEACALHTKRLGQEHQMIYYASGAPTGGVPGFLATVEHLHDLHALDHLGYLGTFFYGQRRPTTYLLNHWYGVANESN